MRRRSGEVFVIGEERLDEGVLPPDDDERGEVEPGVGELRAAEMQPGVATRVRRFATKPRRSHTALGGGALLALGGAWLAVGMGSPEGPSVPEADPVGGVPLMGERGQARQVGRRAPGADGATRPGRRSAGGAAGAVGTLSEHDAEAPAPTPTASAPAAAPASSPTPAELMVTTNPDAASPTPASAATVQREFGP